MKATFLVLGVLATTVLLQGGALADPVECVVIPAKRFAADALQTGYQQASGVERFAVGTMEALQGAGLGTNLNRAIAQGISHATRLGADLGAGAASLPGGLEGVVAAVPACAA